MTDVDQSTREAHWAKTKGLMITTLIIWFIFSYFIHWFADGLNNVTFLGFPLGFYMSAQGSLVIFVVLIFWFARRQHAIDVDHGVAEDEHSSSGS